jgi:hypothetical protein
MNSQHYRDDTYSQRGSKSKRGAIIIKEGKMSVSKTEEENYILGGDQSDIASAKCHFCMKAMDNY